MIHTSLKYVAITHLEKKKRNNDSCVRWIKCIRILSFNFLVQWIRNRTISSSKRNELFILYFYGTLSGTKLWI